MSTANLTPEVTPLSLASNIIAVTQRRKKFIKKKRKNQYKKHQLKGVTSTLGNNFFLTT